MTGFTEVLCLLTKLLTPNSLVQNTEMHHTQSKYAPHAPQTEMNYICTTHLQKLAPHAPRITK